MVEEIGIEEHPGRVRGLRRCFGFNVYFGPSKSSRDKTLKRDIKKIVVVELKKEMEKQDMELEEERKRWREEYDRKLEEDRKKFEAEMKRWRKD